MNGTLPRAAVVICTRPESRRLPRKAFLPIAGVPAIEHILHRLVGCQLPVILAVPTGCIEYDYLPFKFKDQLHLSVFRGNPESPFHRMRDAIVTNYELRAVAHVVRITHDDVLIDQKTMLKLLDVCARDKYVYGWTPEIVEGAGVEVIDRNKLLSAAQHRVEPTEFISYFVKSRTPASNLAYRPRESVCRPYRLTVDYAADWLVLDIVLSHVGPFAPLDKVVEFLDANPFLLNWNHLPTVTAYTCAYNGERWLRDTIRSVLQGTNYDMEYIVVDDGSHDRTAIIASEFSYDRRLRLLKNPTNRGLAACSNQAIDEARGKYVLRVDADDKIVPNAISRLVSTIEKTHAGVVYPAYKHMDETGKIGAAVHSPDVHHHAGGALMDKRLLNEVRFSDGLRHWDGLDLYERIKDRFPIAYVAEPLWFYRQHPTSMSKSTDPERAALKRQIIGGMTIPMSPDWAGTATAAAL